MVKPLFHMFACDGVPASVAHLSRSSWYSSRCVRFAERLLLYTPFPLSLIPPNEFSECSALGVARLMRPQSN